MLHGFLQRLIHVGDLTVIYADGQSQRYGNGSGPPMVVRLTPRGVRRLIRDPDLGLGEAYMEGDLQVIEGSLWDLTELIGRNRSKAPRAPGRLRRLNMAVRRWRDQRNDRLAARRNVAHHYDLSVDLYRRFLDSDLQYSCAYFAEPGMSLEMAQAAKKAHLAAKLHLTAGQRVLDIGCGWGGLALDLARAHGTRVFGATLSAEQLSLARTRAEADGLSDLAQFGLVDYRDLTGPFDRIVSVGMLEHVGAPNLEAYFQQIARLLAEDGVAVVHAIGGRGPPGITQPFIKKYIFPGGYIPSLSEVTAAVERAGLWITDIEILRLHYAETLRHWRERFLRERAAITTLYDERFCRMWEVYLCMSELAFRYLNCMVFQIQLTRRVDALPLTRDYIHDLEQAPPLSATRRAAG